MKDTTKRTVKNLFASLIKNDAAIEGAKTAPWWIALILFLIGNFLPIIPIMVSSGNSYGASFLSSYTFGYERGLAETTTKLKTDGYDFKVINANLIEYYNDEPQTKNTWEEDPITHTNDSTPIATYDAKVQYGENYITEKSFNLYYTNRPLKGEVSVQSLINEIESIQYVVGTATPTVFDPTFYADAETLPATYIPNYLVLFAGGSYSKIYQYHSTTVATATYSGFNWNGYENYTSIMQKNLEVANVEANLRDVNYVNGVLDNWRLTFNKAYKTQKNTNFWFSSGLYYGIYLLLGLFMGLMMFLLTRGKRNPNHGLSILTCFGIHGWTCFTPALLGMIIGFLFSQASGIGYIVLIGLRTMWLAMRQLNPSYIPQ